jgi:Domain of unknown function DUF11/Beta-propeller repeat
VRLNRRWLGIARSRGGVVAAILMLALLGAAALKFGLGVSSLTVGAQYLASNFPPKSDTPNPTLKAYGQLPLIFEPNHGQSDPQVKFLAHGGAYGLFLTADSAVLRLQRPTRQHSGQQVSAFSMKLANANPHANVQGTDQLPGKSNYFIGNDPSQWHRDIPQFARVRYANIYSGIDLVFYGNPRRLEYDFELRPGSDPRQVALKFAGTQRMRIDARGDLVLTIPGGDVRLQAPRVYQKIGDEQRAVQGRFEVRGKNKIGFALGEYDRSRTLIIDPILTYSTYLGGSADEACSVILGDGTPLSGCPAVAVDSASNAYIAGSTTSTNFPTLSPLPNGATKVGIANIFVSKFNAAGDALVFSTYLGGNGIDYTAGVAVDQGFDVLVAGTTSSTNFPTNGTNAPFQATPASTNDHVFVSRLTPAGNSLFYSTYLSGNGKDTASGLAVDSVGNAYVTGITTSTNTPPASSFPATLGAIQTSSRATSQFFLTKVSPALSGPSSLSYSTYFGGSTTANAAYEAVGGGVAVDPSSNVYITGGTSFSDMTVLNALQGQGTLQGIANVFVAEINPAAISGTQLLYSTYLGGSGIDIGYGIAADGASAYVTGSTSSTNFPAAGAGVYQLLYGGGVSDAFLAKLANPVITGTTPGSVTLAYSTYIGGLGQDAGLAVAVDSIQGARVTGWTNSNNIPPLNNSIQPALAPGTNGAFVARIDTTATVPNAPGHYFTYLGGSVPTSGTANTYGTGIAVDLQGASYVSGETNTSDLLVIAKPVSSPFQINLQGGTDAFLSKLGPSLSLLLSNPPTVTPSTVGVGNLVTFEYTITNTGDAASAITFTDTLPTSGASFTSATVSPGSCGTANSGTVECFIGTLNAGATATASIGLTPTANLIPFTTPIAIGNSASVGVPGAIISTASGSVTVNDFNITVSPTTATVPAGVPATYTATITPTGSIPDSVTLSCSSGLPTGATCTETTNPFPDLTSGAVSTVLVINTTARVTTITDLQRTHMPIYAAWLPVSGLALLGVGIGGSRKRRVLMAILLAGFFSLIVFQPACSSSQQVSTTTGTPAGTYVVTVTATSGSATRNAVVTLVVQ